MSILVDKNTCCSFLPLKGGGGDPGLVPGEQEGVL
jgi:hypothetical protein